jgi:hypothetical protein
MLKEEDRVPDFFRHASLGQAVLELQGHFVIDETETKNPAYRFSLVRPPHIFKISSEQGGVNIFK